MSALLNKQRIADVESQYTKQLLEQDEIIKVPDNPFDNSNIFSRMLFFWVNPLLKNASKKSLTQDDIFNLRQKDSSVYNFEKFEKVYEEIKDDPKITNKVRAAFYRIYKKEIITIVILYFFNISSNILNMISIQLLLNAFGGSDITALLPGLFGMFLAYIFQSIIQSSYKFQYSLLTVRMTGALSMKIFKKTLIYPIYKNQFYKIGDILNMVQVDILQIVQYIQNVFVIIFVFPFMIIAFIIVYSQIKNFSIILVMLATVIVFFLFSVLFGKIYGSLQKKFMHEKDLRMRSLEEMMRGIKTIKYNGLETFFDSRVKNKREKEVKKLRIQNFLSSLNNYIQNLSNTLLVFIVSIAFGIDSLNEFLVIQSSFSIILGFISVLPSSIQGLVVGLNSMQRLDNFLLEGFIYKQNMEITQNTEEKSKNINQSIVLKNATFSWKNSINMNTIQESVKLTKKERTSISEKQKIGFFQVENLNLSIKKGEYIVFYGDLGSGKSSILQGILGEMEVDGGEDQFKEMVKVNGSISLSSQQPWIIQDTVKENIIFGQSFDLLRYKQSLHACCLEEDISYFVDGDLTNIGEKGETLSGGQRKRINLARAIYKDSDIYMLDDPLSALDIGVATHIAKECFEGMLKSKTRIIFTNNLLGMEKADKIYIVQNGQITNSGKYNQIKRIIAAGGNKQYNEELEQQEEESERYQSSRILKSNPHTSKRQNQNNTNYTQKLIKSEDIQQGRIKFDVYKEFFKNLGGITFIIALLLVLSGFILLNTLSRLVQFEVKEDASKEEQKHTVMIFCLYDALRVTSIFIYEILIVFRMVYLSKFLHNSIVTQLLRASFTKFYNLITTGRLMNRLSKDIFEIDIYIPKDLAQVLNQLASMVVSAVCSIMVCNIKLFPIVLVYFIMISFLQILFLRAKRQVVRIEATSKSPILQYFSEIIRGVFYLRNCVDHQIMVNTFQQYVDIDLRNQIAVNGIQYWFECITNFLTMFPIIISCIIQFYDNENSANKSIMMAVQISNFAITLIQISVSWVNYETHMVNYERCFRLKQNIVEEAYEVSNERDSQNQLCLPGQKNNEYEDLSQDSESSENSRFDSQQNEIIFKNASFQYRADIPNCLTNINIKMSGKQKIGIVGRTGAGKTSITLALTKVIDLVEGDVFINKKSITSYSLNSLRETISVVSQEPYIYEGTLKTNLDPYNHYSHQSIAEVYTKCGFNSCYSFKQGLDTEISQLGDNLSEGEKQLISIARIILKNSKIVIVDEPTSNIDIQMEEQVTNLLNECFKDCLMITIAHKIKTIMSSDKILVLDHGKVQEYDTPQRLLSDQNSLFSGIINMMNKNTIN